MLDLLIASGKNPYVTSYTVIKKIWEKSHPESFAFASQDSARHVKPQRYSPHDARGWAEPLYLMTGKSRQEHLQRADELKLTRRADTVSDEVDMLHRQIAQLSLQEVDRTALLDDIRSLYFRKSGGYNKSQSIEVFKLVAQHQAFWPDTDTQHINAEQKQVPGVLKRDIPIDNPKSSTSISLHVTGTPDFMWPSGVVKLKNRMHVEDRMLDKWRYGDHAESSLYHILSLAYPNLKHANYR